MDRKIDDVNGLVEKTDFNSKITEVEGKMPSITGLATNSALTAVENKIPDINNLVKKTDYNTKISGIEKKIADHNHDKYITTPEFNTLAANVFNARLAQANLITKTDFDAKLTSLNTKITSNKSKHLLVENELKKLEKFDAACFRCKIILMVMAFKISLFFNRCTNILKELAIIFLHGNQKDCLMKNLVLLQQHLLINLLQV